MVNRMDERLTLYERILENPYRILNLRGDEDHVGLRRAADAALRRLRVGLPLVSRDSWPAIPAAACTEARVRDALARLLVPATRLEARMFWYAHRPGQPFYVHADLLLFFYLHSILFTDDWAFELGQWLDALERNTFVDEILSEDRIVPSLRWSDVADFRARWPKLLASSGVASFRRFLQEGNVRDARLAYDFLARLALEGDIRGATFGEAALREARAALQEMAEAAFEVIPVSSPGSTEAVTRFARLWPLVRYTRVSLRTRRKPAEVLRDLILNEAALSPAHRAAAVALADGTPSEGYVRRMGCA